MGMNHCFGVRELIEREVVIDGVGVTALRGRSRGVLAESLYPLRKRP